MITLITVDLHPIYPQHALTSGHHHRPLQASQVGHIHVLCVFCQVGVIDKKRLKRPRFESITGPSSCNLPLHRLSRFCRTVFGSGSILMSACIGWFISDMTWYWSNGNHWPCHKSWRMAQTSSLQVRQKVGYCIQWIDPGLLKDWPHSKSPQSRPNDSSKRRDGLSAKLEREEESW